MDKANLPVVNAYLMAGAKVLVVNNCPYCHGYHYHPTDAAEDDLVRMAGCSGGQYQIVIEDLPVAKARFGCGPTDLVVDVCPYCGETHRHHLTSDPEDKLVRTAACLRGEYQLVIEGKPNAQ